MDELIREIEKRIYKWEHTRGSSNTYLKAKARADECKQIIKIIKEDKLSEK